MKALITGSAGFVGRHLHQALSLAEVHTVDLANDDDVMQVFQHHERYYDVVFHCAAFVGGRAGIDGKPAYLHAYNTMLDAALFTWALRNHPGRVVYFSSSAAYPLHDQCGPAPRPLHEDLITITSPGVPETSYGMVKLHGEQMAADYRDTGAKVTVLRPFSGYGTDQDLAYPFPTFMARARAREDPFPIWGTGAQVRDWIHIDDIVGATLAAVNQGIDGPVNLATGIGTTFDTLAYKAAGAAGYQTELIHLLDKPGGVDYRVGDPTRLHEFYKPTITLDEGIHRALVSR